MGKSVILTLRSGLFIIVVQSFSCVWLFATPADYGTQVSLSFTHSWSLLKLISIESVIPSNHLILCHSLLLPSVFPSIRVFSNKLGLHIRWPKYWSFIFSIVLPVNVQGWFPLELTDCLISLLSKGLWSVFSSTTILKDQFSGIQPSLWPNKLGRDKIQGNLVVDVNSQWPYYLVNTSGHLWPSRRSDGVCPRI